MSRTDKDRPLWLRMKEQVRKGRIRHNHFPTDAFKRFYRFQSADRTFDRSDTEGIDAYRAELETTGGVSYTLEMIPAVEVLDPESMLWHWEPKKVKFIVSRYWATEAHDGECLIHSSSEKLGSLNGHCWPEWDRDNYPYYGKWDFKPPRARVKVRLNQATRTANNLDLEDHESEFMEGYFDEAAEYQGRNFRRSW